MSTVENNFLTPELHSLERHVFEALSSRLKTSPSYSDEEIVRVSGLSKRLFHDGFCLNEDQTNRVRALCSLSQSTLKPANEISSHRKLIGPLIVFIKRLTWPLISVHLRDVFVGIQEFQSLAVETLAEQILATEELRQLNSKNIVKR